VSYQQFFFPNNDVLFQCTNRAITDLLITEVVCKIYSLPKVVNPLSVSVNSTGKERLIKYLTLTICKYEGVKEAKVYAANKKHCYKLDLRHRYHHIFSAGYCGKNKTRRT
jgi:hypothetical protein